MARCTWISGDIAEPLACALPATVGGLCDDHAHDVERELAMERLAEAERDVVRALYLIRALGGDLERWRPCVDRMRGITKRTIAAALIDGGRLEPDLARELRRITDRNPVEPVGAAGLRHLDALRDLERAPAHRSTAA